MRVTFDLKGIFHIVTTCVFVFVHVCVRVCVFIFVFVYVRIFDALDFLVSNV